MILPSMGNFFIAEFLCIYFLGGTNMLRGKVGTLGIDVQLLMKKHIQKHLRISPLYVNSHAYASLCFTAVQLTWASAPGTSLDRGGGGGRKQMEKQQLLLQLHNCTNCTEEAGSSHCPHASCFLKSPRLVYNKI